jgi:rRNA maturation RNase YbeY
MIAFHYADVTFRIKDTTKHKSWLEAIPPLYKKSIQQIDVIFCSDEYLLQMNNDHLQHDYYTDIITFDLADSGSQELVGELYISIDRVRENAKLVNTPLASELRRVMAHGLLHLCGLADKTEAQIAQMRKAEEAAIISY